MSHMLRRGRCVDDGCVGSGSVSFGAWLVSVTSIRVLAERVVVVVQRAWRGRLGAVFAFGDPVRIEPAAVAERPRVSSRGCVDLVVVVNGFPRLSETFVLDE